MKLRDLSRIPPTFEERAAVREALNNNASPITIAILGSSIVEHELETELRSFFRRSDDETWKLLTGDTGPLGTFNQKIIAAYGFGIVDEVYKKALDAIRQIRNAFAHTKRLIDFDHELIEKELKTLKLPTAKRSFLYKQLVSIRAIEGGPRTAYILLCFVVNIRLLDRQLRRSKAKSYARKRASQRREELAKVLRRPPSSRRLGLLGLLGNYQPGDPKKTILGEAALAASELESDDDGKTDK